MSACLTEHWGTGAKNKFIEKLTQKIHQVSAQPDSCLVSSQFEGLHKCVVTKQTTFYYRVATDQNEIEIITIFDTRQHPEKLKKDLK